MRLCYVWYAGLPGLYLVEILVEILGVGIRRRRNITQCSRNPPISMIKTIEMGKIPRTSWMHHKWCHYVHYVIPPFFFCCRSSNSHQKLQGWATWWAYSMVCTWEKDVFQVCNVLLNHAWGLSKLMPRGESLLVSFLSSCCPSQGSWFFMAAVVQKRWNQLNRSRHRRASWPIPPSLLPSPAPPTQSGITGIVTTDWSQFEESNKKTNVFSRYWSKIVCQTEVGF